MEISNVFAVNLWQRSDGQTQSATQRISGSLLRVDLTNVGHLATDTPIA